MHSPSLLTPILASQVIEDHAREARAARDARSVRRSGGGPFGRLRARRSGASRVAVPRGRPLPRPAR